MKVIVIGSGLIGITTAYALGHHGHEVIVLDREAGPGRDTSFANGALLTPSMSEPWNAPGCWRVLLASLGRSDSPLQLRIRALPSLSTWGISFLAQSSPPAFKRNSISNVRLALYSLEVMRSLLQETGIEYGRTARGSLRLFRNPASWNRAFAAADPLQSEGLRFKKVSLQETIELEPALGSIESELAGAIHCLNDEVGDAHQFCVALTERARARGVTFHFKTEVAALEMQSGKVVALRSNKDRFIADRYVVAAGSYSTLLVRSLGISLPVRPAKGYSVTFADSTEHPSLGIPLVDDDLHAVVVPLRGAIRTAGTAEFAGYDRSLDPARVQSLKRFVKAVLPRAALDPVSAKSWCGLRPMSADGVPIIGATPISNLFLNTGHGHLGWTLAAGSAQLLTNLISGVSSKIDAAPFTFARWNR